MSFTIKYVPFTELKEIKEEWISLEKGTEMTIFQTYDWYEALANYYIPSNTKNYESIFAIVGIDGNACLIAPLWIIKKTFRLLNKKGVYLLGRDSYSDYLNLIYTQFIPDAFDYLLNELCNKYKTEVFVFEHLNETSSTYKYITSSNKKIITDFIEPCVSLELPRNKEDYWKLFSKNGRQNIRTANNRLKTDDITISFNFDDNVVDTDTCLKIRDSKLSVKKARIPKIKIYKYRFINRLLYHFPLFIPIKHYPYSKVMTAHDEKGELCAFFNYIYDIIHKKVIIISAGTDLSFARYSPGILLLFNFANSIIEEGEYNTIDFTRGDEKYKFSLGGEQFNNHNITFHSNKHKKQQ